MTEEKCPRCGNDLIFTKSESTIHYGRLDCPQCKVWIKWVKNPDKENIRTQTSKYSIKQIMKYHKFPEEPFCFFCLRTKAMLGQYETLTRDHIIELDKGGNDTMGNLQILCSACHKLKNWARLYLNWHFKDDTE